MWLIAPHVSQHRASGSRPRPSGPSRTRRPQKAHAAGAQMSACGRVLHKILCQGPRKSGRRLRLRPECLDALLGNNRSTDSADLYGHVCRSFHEFWRLRVSLAEMSAACFFRSSTEFFSSLNLVRKKQSGRKIGTVFSANGRHRWRTSARKDARLCEPSGKCKFKGHEEIAAPLSEWLK